MSTVTIIEPPKLNLLAQMADVWRHRHLLVYFGENALQAYYRDTIIGWPWLIIRPLLPVFVLAVLFERVSQFQVQGVPYLVFLLSGFSLWNLVSIALRFSTRSVRSHRKFITRSHFPRIIIPTASITPVVVQFAAALGILFLIAVYYRLAHGVWYLKFGPNLLVALPAAFLTVLLVLGVGYWTSVLNALARDVRMSLPLFLQMWLFLTPVLYPLEFIPREWKWAVYTFNPMAPLIETFKWSLLGAGEFHPLFFGVGALVAAGVFFSGVWFFSRCEPVIADYV